MKNRSKATSRAFSTLANNIYSSTRALLIITLTYTKTL